MHILDRGGNQPKLEEDWKKTSEGKTAKLCSETQCFPGSETWEP